MTIKSKMYRKNIIFTNGICFLLAMYRTPKKIDSIDKYRYLSFVKIHGIIKVLSYPVFRCLSTFILCLLSSPSMARNKLNPENYGWVFKDNNLKPIQTLLLPTPEKLLYTIFFVIVKKVIIIIVVVKKSVYFVY